MLPGHGASELEWLLFEQSGVITSRQAIDHLGYPTVRSNLVQRRWRTICRGVLLTENGRLWREQQLWVAVLGAGDGALLAGMTAAIAGGVTGLRDEPLDVLVPARRTRAGCLARRPPDMPAVRLHRTSVLPEDHRQVGRPPRTTIARAVIDAAAWAGSDREAQTVILRACQQRRVDPSELQRVLADLPRARRRRLIGATINDAAGGAQALSEVDLVTLCRRFGLPQPTLQRHRKDSAGRNRWLDAYWEEFHLHVEVDGAHHMEVEQWAADMLRQNQIWVSGDRILRFPAHLLRTHPTAVATQLREALSTAPPIRPAAPTSAGPTSAGSAGAGSRGAGSREPRRSRPGR